MELLLLFIFLMLLAIIVLLSVQLHLTRKQMQLWREQWNIPVNNKSATEEGKPDNKETGGEIDTKGKGVKKEEDKSHKEKVLDSILYRKKEIGENDLPRVEKELMGYFAKYPTKDYFNDLNAKEYYRFIDLRDNPKGRVVVIGDIHCDYLSLAAALLKLSVSDYDYFGKAYFVFLGDYLDRGTALFEPLLLLMDLKRILGERMIMLRGNHELIAYDSQKQSIRSRVIPSQSSECLNDFCGNNKTFLEKFSYFYRTLPTYVYLKTKDKVVLLTHASIPRSNNHAHITIHQNNGSIVFDDTVTVTDQLNIRNMILHDMVWGDPKEVEEKIQCDGRFEFGSKQFDQFVLQNHIDLMIRSHEEVPIGYKAFFGKRLYTLFSTGGEKNPQTGYPNVEPAFAVVQNQNCYFENSYIYQKNIDGKRFFANLFSNIAYTEAQIENCKLNEEFLCDEVTWGKVKSIMKEVRSGFSDN